MKPLSEKQAREIDRYFKRLVKQQPQWLKNLFEAQRIAFVMYADGLLGIEVDDELPEEERERARTFIAKWMNKHPANFIEERQYVQ